MIVIHFLFNYIKVNSIIKLKYKYKIIVFDLVNI